MRYYIYSSHDTTPMSFEFWMQLLIFFLTTHYAAAAVVPTPTSSADSCVFAYSRNVGDLLTPVTFVISEKSHFTIVLVNKGS